MVQRELQGEALPLAPATGTRQDWVRSNWLFGALFVGYVLIILAGREYLLGADAGRYIDYATKLLHGAYLRSGSQELWAGPGYPLVLVPFAGAGAWQAAALLNAVFMLGAILYCQATLRQYVSPGAARLAAAALGLYVPALLWLPLLMTETLALFLSAGLIYHGCRLLGQPRFRWAHALAAGFYMGFLALTKILFGYVVEASLALALIVYLIWRREPARRGLLVCVLALAVTAPYLAATYAATGRLNYWGSSGGDSLYWMSSPFPGEYGDIVTRAALERYPEIGDHHRDFLNSIKPLAEVEKDEALKRRAWENISGHPLKFVQNWVANVGRIFFNYPYSYTPQKLSTFAYLLPNSFVVVLGTIALYLAWRAPALMPPELYAVLAFGAVGLGATTIPSAVGRMLVPLAPFLLVGIVVVLSRAIHRSPRPLREAP
jgi:hypothetical protein